MTRALLFCAMRKDTYEIKLSDLICSNKISEIERTTDSIVMKIEKDINQELLVMRKRDEIT